MLRISRRTVIAMQEPEGRPHAGRDGIAVYAAAAVAVALPLALVLPPLEAATAIGFWLATFLIRTHGWTVQQAGTLQGVLTFTIGPIGVMLGGRLTDAWARKGWVDAPLRVGILGALAMLLFAGLYPVVPSATMVAILLVPVNVFAAMPWGAANAAIAEAMPPRMRGQGSAIYQLVVNLVSGALGPTAVALLTDHVFGDPKALRWSLAITTVTGMTIAAALLAWGRGGFVRTVSSLRESSAD